MPKENPYISIPIERYKELIKSERILGLLKAGGVDNWEWYSESLADFYEEESEGRWS
jgi:hypothetical protein